MQRELSVSFRSEAVIKLGMWDGMSYSAPIASRWSRSKHPQLRTLSATRATRCTSDPPMTAFGMFRQRRPFRYRWKHELYSRLRPSQRDRPATTSTSKRASIVQFCDHGNAFRWIDRKDSTISCVELVKIAARKQRACAWMAIGATPPSKPALPTPRPLARVFKTHCVGQGAFPGFPTLLFGGLPTRLSKPHVLLRSHRVQVAGPRVLAKAFIRS